MENTATAQTPTHKFDFDINKIALEDLKALYSHFHIEDFKDAASTADRDSFFKCFIDGETDGNKDAFLLMRLAALLASSSAKIGEVECVSCDGQAAYRNILIYDTKYEIDFCESDYFDLTEGGEQISVVIEIFEVEEILPILAKYDFLKPQIYFEC